MENKVMRFLTNYEDEIVTALPDGSNYLYVMTADFVHLVHRLDGSHMVIPTIQFQTILHQAQAAAKAKK